MIPTRKKTPEELAALREGLGLFQNQEPQPSPPEPQPSPPGPRPDGPLFQKVIGQTPPTPQPEQPPEEERKPRKRNNHSLRKVELPLYPAQRTQHKTTLPKNRRSASDLAELQRREALANFSANPADPVARLKKLEAHPILLGLAYLTALAAIYTAWKTFHYITPISLICVSGLLTAYIFWTKKRSRHHAAILLIILAMTLVFGGIHYAPLFKALFKAYAS